MKTRLVSEKSFDELQEILVRFERSQRKIKIKHEILQLLEKYCNKLRSSDNVFYSLQGSFAESRKDTYVIGVRYLKHDNSYTEDHFLFQKGKNMVAYKDRELEKVLPEYKGTHKWQPLGGH